MPARARCCWTARRSDRSVRWSSMTASRSAALRWMVARPKGSSRLRIPSLAAGSAISVDLSDGLSVGFGPSPLFRAGQGVAVSPSVLLLPQWMENLAGLFGTDGTVILTNAVRIVGIWMLAWLALALVRLVAARIEAAVNDQDDSYTT